MHYYVDGYNLLFSIVEVQEELRKQRDEVFGKLIHILEELQLDVTIVFDAAHQPGEVAWTRTRGVRVVYTGEGETADSYIVSALRKEPKGRRQTVVTSDKRLAWEIRQDSTAATVDVVPFVHWVQSRYRNLHRRRNKIIDRTLDVATTTRVPPPKRETEPAQANTPEECFDYYHRVFSQTAEALPEDSAPQKQAEASASAKKRKKRQPTNEPSNMSDEARWLHLFTEKLDKPDEKDPF